MITVRSLAAALSLIAVVRCVADDAVPTVKVKIRVEDPHGHPVSGAELRGRALRTRAERGAHYGWSPARHGEPATGLTDEDGMVNLSVPRFVTEALETGEVTWIVDHTDYVRADVDLRVDEDPGVVNLSHGRKIIVNGVFKETGKPITDNLYATVSRGGAREWNPIRNGKLISRTLSYDCSLMRLIYLPDDGSVLFSELIDLTDKGQMRRTVVRDVPLAPGTRIVGELSPEVPRPIVNGYLGVEVTHRRGFDDYRQRLSWRHWVAIERDGTFAVESVPRDCIGQLIAVCDGWLPAPTDRRVLEELSLDQFVERSGSRVTPHVIPISGDEVSCTLRMLRTASCRVKVVSPDGSPVAGARVAMSPNQFWFGGGSNLVGDVSRQDLVFRLSPEEREAISGWTEEARQFIEDRGIRKSRHDVYVQTTNDHGIAVIRELLGGTADSPRMRSVRVTHDDYELPANDRDFRELRVGLILGEVSEVTVIMDPKGTTLLGE